MILMIYVYIYVYIYIYRTFLDILSTSFLVYKRKLTESHSSVAKMTDAFEQRKTRPLFFLSVAPAQPGIGSHVFQQRMLDN